MESSTTNPIASTTPNSESVLIEKPKIGNKANAAISETGTAHKGIMDARQPCRKMYTTRITSSSAFQRVLMISFMPWLTGTALTVTERLDAYDIRQPHGARDDCRVRRAAASLRTEAGHLGAAQVEVAGVEIAGGGGVARERQRAVVTAVPREGEAHA